MTSTFSAVSSQLRELAADKLSLRRFSPEVMQGLASLHGPLFHFPTPGIRGWWQRLVLARADRKRAEFLKPSGRPPVTAVRFATVDDLEAVTRIHNQWVLNRTNPQAGFFLTEMQPIDYLQYLHEPGVLFLVARKVDPKNGIELLSSPVEGFLIARRAMLLELAQLEKLTWVSAEVKAEVFSDDRWNWHVEQVGVDPAKSRQGVGPALYADLFRICPTSSISAYVAQAPYRNILSEVSHRKLGFRPVANFEADEFHGISNYRSELYLRSGVGAARQSSEPVSIC